MSGEFFEDFKEAYKIPSATMPETVPWAAAVEINPKAMMDNMLAMIQI